MPTFPIPGYSGSISLHWGSDSGASDLFAPRGTPVVAMVAGTVQRADYDELGGNAVLMHGDDGLDYYYAHLGDLSVSPGRVAAGALLGHLGETGNARGTGAHLHLGIGYGIRSGGGASGGAGFNFDAVDYLKSVHAGGSPPAPIVEVVTGVGGVVAGGLSLPDFSGLGRSLAPLVPAGMAVAGIALAVAVAQDLGESVNPSGIYHRPTRWGQQELRLLDLYSRGHTDREAAHALAVAPSTVRDTKRRLFAKLGANTKAELMKHALRRGLAA